MKDDITHMVCEFHSYGKITKGVNSSFFCLILKKSSPQHMGDYRPISLIGCIYTILAKLLANRLRKVLDKVISHNQFAFLKGRHILDGVIILNEIIHDAKISGKQCSIFKIDFEKAFDSVSWGFLDHMMELLGFCPKWRGWIMECLSTTTTSVLVNGSHTDEIHLKCGLRQGDPLSPFLFLIVDEGLSGLMHQACALGFFSPYKVGSNNIQVSFLQFADDSIIIGDCSDQNFWTIKSTLKLFELSFGLKINFRKCCLYGMNIDDAHTLRLAGFLQCRFSYDFISYLGIPVDVNHNRKTSWSALINRIQLILSSWKSKHISFGGRVILVNAVLSALPIYFLFFYKALSSVVCLIQQIQHNFLWGETDVSRNINWVKWENVCKTKIDGGLRVKDISSFNIAMLDKWKWRLMNEGDSLWCRGLKSKYGHDFHKHSRVTSSSSLRKRFAWVRDLASISPRETGNTNWFWENIFRRIEDGHSTSFWHDIWLGDILIYHIPKTIHH
ncbi:putative RNA-directed DNA polymerase [Lupinus albus]|uniref:Putative RNA-directed DNA polymerase n=1 Tax=Lupinus albus TaxID=3870 RepID=A0A6A4QRJ0_LUPAL|nr:putative RNA-directed DNA polymerase [Lupinus albus]